MKSPTAVPAKKPARRSRASEGANGNGAAVAVRAREVGDGSGDRVAIGSYLGGGDVFEEAVGEFSWVYADQNERDYAELKAAADSGRVVAGDPLR